MYTYIYIHLFKRHHKGQKEVNGSEAISSYLASAPPRDKLVPFLGLNSLICMVRDSDFGYFTVSHLNFRAGGGVWSRAQALIKRHSSLGFSFLQEEAVSILPLLGC